MSGYSKVLLAVDLTDSCHRVAQHAAKVAETFDAELHIVHVLEPQSLAYGDEVPMDLSALHQEIYDQAQSLLSEFCKEFDVFEQNQHLVFGRIESEIHKIATEHNMDLIVVGSHGRHGLAILFGSTLNGVLHKATCDVLAVRVT